jgi:hypothetical protein
MELSRGNQIGKLNQEQSCPTPDSEISTLEVSIYCKTLKFIWSLETIIVGIVKI